MAFRIITLLTVMIVIQFCDSEAENTTNPVTVGSKKFTENIILGEIVAHLSRDLGYATVHRRELGGTRILWNALLSGDIDIYPEYNGTIRKEILGAMSLSPDAKLDDVLADYGISISAPLGFNNTYAISVKKELAEKLNLVNISDLLQHPDLVFGFTNEFMDREDGWPGLQKRYQLPQKNVRGLDHDLAYRGLASGSIHVIDTYSTDAEIRYYDLMELADDLRYFPNYDAVLLYRTDLVDRAAELVAQFEKLYGRITEEDMIEMNAQAKLNKIPAGNVAANFVNDHFSMRVKADGVSIWQRLWDNTKAHILLVAISLSAAISVAIPLGIVAAKFNNTGKIILSVVGIIQTIPSLALLVFMIPMLGIGGPPAVVALFLYSLLPIVRNTYTGIHDIAQPIRESALAIGLPPVTRLRRIELPLASRSILAGIKTSAVINVGTATLGALIGAGGYGQPILTGIRLDDVGLILQGAVPAALLAIFVQWLFDITEYIFVPKGLRLPVSANK